MNKAAAILEANVKGREVPVIIAANVIINSDGFAWRDIMIRLPKDAVADDLKEPGMWRKVQASDRALRRHDHLYIVSFEEDWAAECIVADATKDRAVLTKPRLIAFPDRYERLFQDDMYRVSWVGTGYCVERKSDGHRMTQPVATAQIAERQLVSLHPRVAA